MFMPTDQEPSPSSPLEAAELSAPAPAAIEKLADVLSKSERPVIVVGGGAIFGNSAEKLRRFVELAGIPVIASAKAIGILPDDHPFYGGPAAALAMAGAEGTRPDTVLLLGARMGMFLGGLSDAVIPSGAFVAQVEINPDEIGRVRRSNLPIVADCSLVLDDLLDKTKSRKWSKKTEWAETLRRHKVRSQTLFADASKRSARGAMHPYHAVKAVLDALPPEVVIVSDGGETGNWVGDFGRSSGPGQFLRCGYLGCLGVAPGFAIGAARARPDRPVICFTGDGAAGFNIQEFDTMVRHDLPILTVILNNAAWGMSRNAQLLLYGANREVIVSLASTDYDIVAKGFGLSGIRIDDPEEIGPSVKRALQSRKPMCLNLIVDADIMHPRTRAMVGDVSGADGIPIPYYANIPKKSA
jgi:acetolactate synthase-1/2/3 large subunit